MIVRYCCERLDHGLGTGYVHMRRGWEKYFWLSVVTRLENGDLSSEPEQKSFSSPTWTYIVDILYYCLRKLDMVLHAFPHKTLEVKAARLRIQGVPYLYSGVDAILGYIRFCLNKNSNKHTHLPTPKHTQTHRSIKFT